MSCLQSGSSESARATKLATLTKSAAYVARKFSVLAARDQTKHLPKVVDSGAEVHLVCPAQKQFLKNVTKLNVPLQLETTGGDSTLDRGPALWRHRLSRLCVQSNAHRQSLQHSQR